MAETTTTQSTPVDLSAMLSAATSMPQTEEDIQAAEQIRSKMDLFERRLTAVFTTDVLEVVNAQFDWQDQPVMTITVNGNEHRMTERHMPTGHVMVQIDGVDVFQIKHGPRGQDAMVQVLSKIVSSQPASA
jgi:hypothetical protein